MNRRTLVNQITRRIMRGTKGTIREPARFGGERYEGDGFDMSEGTSQQVKALKRLGWRDVYNHVTKATGHHQFGRGGIVDERTGRNYSGVSIRAFWDGKRLM